MQLDDGCLLQCIRRGKRSDLACGDRVSLERTSDDQGVITGVAPRRSLLYRSDQWREKLIAANATQVVVVVATEPSFSDELVTRCLLAAEHQGLRAAIVLNKIDLHDRLGPARARLQPLRDAGYAVIELEAAAGADALRPRLAGQLSVLVGQSGMGKSTLINALVPGAVAVTREISAALDTGKHATTLARLYRLERDSALIDSPGVQEFGLAHLGREDIEQGFPEFRPLLGGCRFRDCRHGAEPDCAITAALRAGTVAPTRLAHYRLLIEQLAARAP